MLSSIKHYLQIVHLIFSLVEFPVSGLCLTSMLVRCCSANMAAPPISIANQNQNFITFQYSLATCSNELTCPYYVRCRIEELVKFSTMRIHRCRNPWPHFPLRNRGLRK